MTFVLSGCKLFAKALSISLGLEVLAGGGNKESTDLVTPKALFYNMYVHVC